jgi:hypothetical protein
MVQSSKNGRYQEVLWLGEMQEMTEKKNTSMEEEEMKSPKLDYQP